MIDCRNFVQARLHARRRRQRPLQPDVAPLSQLRRRASGQRRRLLRLRRTQGELVKTLPIPRREVRPLDAFRLSLHRLRCLSSQVKTSVDLDLLHDLWV